MKSLQVINLMGLGIISPDEADEYSELKVLKTPAGYYLGTTCGFEPGSRDTGYFTEEAHAKSALELLETLFLSHGANCILPWELAIAKTYGRDIPYRINP